MITLTKNLDDSYQTVYQFLDALFECTGKIPVALFEDGSANGVAIYQAIITYPNQPVERELPAPTPSFGRKVAEVLGLIKARKPQYETVIPTTGTTYWHYRNFSICVHELTELVTDLLDTQWIANAVVSGVNVASDWWAESKHGDDEQYAALYDYTSRGLQELGREWADHISIEKKLLESLATAKMKLTNAIAGNLVVTGPCIEYMTLAYLSRSWRFGNTLYMNPDHLATTYHPVEILDEIKAFMTLKKEPTDVPSQAFHAFIDSVIEIGPDFDNKTPPFPKTIRPEKKLENFLGAVNDKVAELFH